MKKIVILFCFLGLIFSKSNAQDEIRFGFQFSPTFSWMKTNDKRVNNNGSLILGAKLGAIGEYYFRENYSLSSGIGFAFNHSGRLKYEDRGQFLANSDLSIPGLDTLDAGSVLKYNLQYVEIPLSLKLRSGYFGTLRGFMEIPMLYIGINTQAKGTITGNSINTEDEDVGPDVRFFNFSWGLGGGFEYEIGSNSSLVGGLYYQQGFTDVTKNGGFVIDQAGTTKKEDSRASVRAFIIRIGLMF